MSALGGHVFKTLIYYRMEILLTFGTTQTWRNHQHDMYAFKCYSNVIFFNRKCLFTYIELLSPMKYKKMKKMG